MYTQYLETKPSNIGSGMFTKVRIPANVPVMEFQGAVITYKELPTDSSIYLQVGPNTYLSPIGVVNGVDFINHNCDPNCTIHIVGNRAILYSLYVIPAGAELTFDYSTTSTESLDSWKMDCQCGSYKCRRVISGFQYLSEELQQDYKTKRLVPMYITEPNMIQKRER